MSPVVQDIDAKTDMILPQIERVLLDVPSTHRSTQRFYVHSPAIKVS